jgi:hypothetical protein
MPREGLLAVALASALVLAGCGQESSWFGGSRANIAGATSVLEYEKIENVNAAELADYFGATPADSLAVAIDKFNKGTPDAELRRQRRDTIQDRLLLASQNRCAFYEDYLKRFQSDSSAFFGSMATILGGAGAIVTNANSARTLAGLAGIFSGVGAELQKDFFSNITSAVIVPGIEKRRRDILQEIVQRRCYDATRYTVGLALMDAVRYHAACSMDAGIAEGGNAIREVSTPGAAGLAAMAEAGKAIASGQSQLVAISASAKAPPSGTPSTQGTPAPGGSQIPAPPSSTPTATIVLPGTLFGSQVSLPDCVAIAKAGAIIVSTDQTFVDADQPLSLITSQLPDNPNAINVAIRAVASPTSLTNDWARSGTITIDTQHSTASGTISSATAAGIRTLQNGTVVEAGLLVQRTANTVTEEFVAPQRLVFYTSGNNVAKITSPAVAKFPTDVKFTLPKNAGVAYPLLATQVLKALLSDGTTTAELSVQPIGVSPDGTIVTVTVAPPPTGSDAGKKFDQITKAGPTTLTLSFSGAPKDAPAFASDVSVAKQ